MRTAPVVPARIDFDADGTPVAPAFGDRYHPRTGALAQARHVFLAGSGLPERWRGRDRFVVLETGFGLGHNALATWHAWREDAARSRHLSFVSIERHPPTREALAALPRDPLLRPLADRLVAQWPPLVAGLHRIAFDSEQVELLLAFGDVADWLPQIVARVDAFYLDGFAPAKNPAMWEPRLFKAMARLAAPDATAATWSAASVVRAGLAAAGFEVRAAPGQGGKREITLARYAPRHAARPSPRIATPWAQGGATPRVAIVGAGLAGSAVASALARRHGIGSTVHEAAAKVAAGASNGAAGVFHAVVHRDDGRHARWYRAAAFAARADALDLVATEGPDAGSVGGLLRLESRGLAELRATALALGLPDDHARPVDAADAHAIAGARIDSAAWWFPGGGWLDPSRLVRHRLAADRGALLVRTGSPIAALRREGGVWLLVDAAGRVVDEADAVVCANAAAAAALAGHGDWPIERRRGQASAVSLRSIGGVAPRVPLAGAGYAVAVDADTLWFGATSSPTDDDGAEPRPHDRDANWERACRLLPELAARARDAASGSPLFVDGRVGIRCAAPDRLPVVGAVPARDAVSARPEQPWHAPRLEGLFVVTALGSRGIASSALGGALVAARIAGAPLPAEADLVDAVDPARFASRRARIPRA